jgi:hypothetical protein
MSFCLRVVNSQLYNLYVHRVQCFEACGDLEADWVYQSSYISGCGPAHTRFRKAARKASENWSRRQVEELTFVWDEAVVVLGVGALLDQDVDLLPLQRLTCQGPVRERASKHESEGEGCGLHHSRKVGGEGKDPQLSIYLTHPADFGLRLLTGTLATNSPRDNRMCSSSPSIIVPFSILS